MDDNQPNDDQSNLPNEQINDDNDQAGSKTPSNDQQHEGYRKQQSRADKAEAENQQLNERLATLEEVAMGSVKEKLVGEFITENKDKYPDVTKEDLADLVNSPDDMEIVAKKLQKKAEDIKERTLANAREVPEITMTEAEKKKALAELKPSATSFRDYLKIATTKLRK